MNTQQAVQTREETILHHRERLNAVLLHIQENIDAPLTVETLADVAGFSPYYFHRIFAAYLRETTSDYVRRIRLEWAARRLILSSEAVTLIALAAGYETPAAFGRAFKRRFQLSPRAFRRLRRPRLYATNWEPLLLQPEIRQRPGHELVYIACVGAEADSETVWTTLRQHAGIAAQPPPSTPSYRPPTYRSAATASTRAKPKATRCGSMPAFYWKRTLQSSRANRSASSIWRADFTPSFTTTEAAAMPCGRPSTNAGCLKAK